MMNSTFNRTPKDQVARAAKLAASILADVAGRRGALDGHIRPVAPGMRVCGPALTVEVRPGDNLMIHAALVLAQPGDVLVIDGKGDLSCALMGELMCTHARAAGIAGVVIDGAVRDVAELRSGILPVFARGASPNGPTKRLAGRIGHPVSVGEVAVAPGDLVVGDDDGVVIVPRGQVEQVLQDAGKKVDAEQKRLRDINEGRLIYGWLEGALHEAGALSAGKSLEQAMAEFGVTAPG
jgi:RraA family protein